MSSESTRNLVKLHQLGKKFESRKGLFGRVRSMMAVSDVTFDIPRGQVTGVVGESGCGKSTLARLVLRLLEPSAGQVHFDGADLGGQSGGALRRLRRRMQMVFQDPYSAIDPRYSMAEALLEPFRIQAIKLSADQARSKVKDLLAMVGLGAQIAESYPHQLSGGQRQRIGIARALALEPDFLVLDEPTASLDVSIQAQIISLLEKLQAELGLTYLFISHDLGLVRYFCDRIVVMYLGRVVEILPDPKAAPRHPYTRTLLDSNFSPDPTKRRNIRRLTGEIASAYDLPPGCSFAARCPHADATCHGQRPELQPDASGHAAACHHPLT
jgi:oligopeptide/dipeptide ABC transporter ATP-binding protein